MTSDLINRFWENVDIGMEEDCWHWMAERTQLGYGLLNTHAKPRKRLLAHRLSLALHLGREIGDGLEVLHRCDNPRCVNPHHLIEGTHHENMLDMCRKGRWNAGPRNGEGNQAAKLNADAVRSIRKRYSQGVSQRQMAREHGLSKFAIHCVVNRITWRHVE